MSREKWWYFKWLMLFFYVAMVGINGLANALPLNGVGTGEVSDSFPNLFTPSGITFAIWGLIYTLLLGYVTYHFFIHEDDLANKEKDLLRLGSYFVFSSVINMLWIFAWHYGFIVWSTVLMLVFLVLLVLARFTIVRMPLRGRERLLILLPFSIYFGWVTVATIASVTATLVYLGWGAWGMSESLWTVIILLVGVFVGGITMLNFRDGAYGLVFLWAYAGILLKHVSASGWAGQYPDVITAVSLSLGAFFFLEVYLAKKALSR